MAYRAIRLRSQNHFVLALYFIPYFYPFHTHNKKNFLSVQFSSISAVFLLHISTNYMQYYFAKNI